MIRVSDAYKQAMSAYLRERSYVTIVIGVIDEEAQRNLHIEGDLDSEYTWWSSLTAPLSSNYVAAVDYATLEQNFLGCSGNQLFLPEKEFWNEYGAYCVISKEVMGSIKFILNGRYSIKGITIDFTDNYPTEFKIVSNEGEHTYTNNSNRFSTDDAVGLNTEWFEIIPITMKGGQQRLRIKTLLMGVGLYITDNELTSFSLNEQCYPISDELPSTELQVDVIDYDDNYNVDNPNAYINYLKTKQQIDISAGITVEDGTIEFINLGKLWLSSWKSAYGTMSFTATDKLAFFNSTVYKSSTSGTIHTRSIYDDCIAILTDMGLSSSDYIVDEYLRTKIIVNPLPESSHAELLQLLANAGRCIIYQDNVGRICIQVNFPYSLTDSDYTLSSTTNADWGSLDHILDNSVDTYYADFTQDFSVVDGSMYVLPEGENPQYLGGTSYVSSDVANEYGEYTHNPKLTMHVIAGFDFSELDINFAGNVPQEIVVHTSWAGVSNDDVTFTGLELENKFVYEFGIFDTITIEITVGSPNSRSLITYLSLGMGNNYFLSKDDMLDHPMGVSEETVSNVKVRVITYEQGEEGPEQVEDEVYYTCDLHQDRGIDVVFENVLISTQSMAKEVAEWLGNYYKNDITYETNYRGEPRLNAGDYIKMANDYNDNLTVEIIEDSLTYNGAFGGNLKLRRSLKEV